jgi:hypothetical protein
MMFWSSCCLTFSSHLRSWCQFVLAHYYCIVAPLLCSLLVSFTEPIFDSQHTLFRSFLQNLLANSLKPSIGHACLLPNPYVLNIRGYVLVSFDNL